MALRTAYALDDVAERLSPRAAAVTLGVFDGVHRGHQRIIEEVTSWRGRDGVETVYLLTFDPHPTVVTHSRRTPPVLTTIEERLELVARFPLDGVFVVPFDETTRHTEYREFIQRYLLEAMDMRRLVIGYDCHFGHKREGSPERVAEEGRRRGFGVTIVPPVELDGDVVSSTVIRETLEAGHVARANHLLGHAYLVSGVVSGGDGRGRELGFPTANLTVEEPLKLWPPRGVYAVRVRLGEATHNGMMNVGTAPTVKTGGPLIEVHLFDFDRAIYGERLYVYCEARLRDERRFRTVADLVDQLHRDREAARAALAG